MALATMLCSYYSHSEMNLAVSKMMCFQYYCGNVFVHLRSFKKIHIVTSAYVFQDSSEMPGNEMYCFYLLLEKRSYRKG